MKLALKYLFTSSSFDFVGFDSLFLFAVMLCFFLKKEVYSRYVSGHGVAWNLCLIKGWTSLWECIDVRVYRNGQEIAFDMMMALDTQQAQLHLLPRRSPLTPYLRWLVQNHRVWKHRLQVLSDCFWFRAQCSVIYSSRTKAPVTGSAVSLLCFPQQDTEACFLPSDISWNVS